MIFDPVTTFFIYIIAMLVIFTLCAFAADQLTAKAERDARRRVRAEARAKRMNGERSSRVEWR